MCNQNRKPMSHTAPLKMCCTENLCRSPRAAPWKETAPRRVRNSVKELYDINFLGSIFSCLQDQLYEWVWERERERELLSDRIFREWGSFTSDNFYVGCRVEITGSPQTLLTAEFARAPGVQQDKMWKASLPSFLPLLSFVCLSLSSFREYHGCDRLA